MRDVVSSGAELITGSKAATEVAEPIYWNYGSFIQQCVDFFILAFCVFLMVKLMNRFIRKREAAPAPVPAPTKEETLLTANREGRDMARIKKAAQNIGQPFVFPSRVFISLWRRSWRR